MKFRYEHIDHPGICGHIFHVADTEAREAKMDVFAWCCNEFGSMYRRPGDPPSDWYELGGEFCFMHEKHAMLFKMFWCRD